jgi:glutamine amidotransferase-like uncharacterized protein
MAASSVALGLYVACLALLAVMGCARTEPNSDATNASILLFNGTGTSPNDVAAVAKILDEKGLDYTTASSKRLNDMTEPELMGYRLIIVPGGNYITMGNSLTPEAARRVRHAVQQGVSYLGICAGGLLAGKAKSTSLDLTAGVKFSFYAVVNQRIHKAAVPVEFANGPTIDHYWEDGPQFTGWGQVVGKYPDGTPAIVEGACGAGWVILCGVHPEAPESWRRGMTFSSSAAMGHEYAGTLIDAALYGSRLPHF